jgi:NAD(P)-dependent dehydrogenase (short-subunit alcohol dehydrogenase family)
MEINGSTTKAKNPEAPDSVEEQTAEIIACLDAGATIIQTGAPKGVVVNAFGTNFLNYPDAIETYGGAEALENVAKHIPLGRLGEPEEAAHLAMALLDGRNMFTTGSFFPIAGGYNNDSDSLKFP